MVRSTALTRNTDSKGRITLGEAFSNRTLLMETRGDEIILRLARVIPEREAWLYEKGEALASVRRGLKESRSGSFARKGPDLGAARKLADRLKDE